MTDGKRGNAGAVLALLHKVAVANGARVLLATEKGSRSIGLDGKRSDWDVRFVYVRAMSEYHGLAAGHDVLSSGNNAPETDDRNEGDMSPEMGPQVVPARQNAPIDYEGWDVLKALKAAAASNSVILEALHGPVRHYGDKAFTAELTEIMEEFNTLKVMHAYASLARAKLRLADKGWGDKYLHKGYLYAIRSVMMVLLLDVEPLDFPPMRFEDLRRALRHNPDVKALGGAIDEIVASKRSGDKAGMQVRMPAVDEWLERVIPTLKGMADRAPQDRNPNPLRLDHLCRQTVEGRVG